MAKRSAEGEPIIIKKYANRRLYNTHTSSYITLDDLAKMVRENVDFHVLDAKSGDDITHTILTQIIVEEESHGSHMLPVSFLRDLIRMYGNSMQAMMPSYLEASMTNLQKNREQIQEAFAKGLETNPLAQMAEAGAGFVEIAGNDDIMLTALSDAPTHPDAIHSFARQGYGNYRHLLLVPVTELDETLRGLADQGLRLEHVHDY